MDGGDVCRYVGVYLLWRRSQKCLSWGIRVRYLVDHIDLENLTLVSCGSGLESWCVGGGDRCRYFGFYVRYGRVMVVQSSLRGILAIIPVGVVLSNSLVSCVFSFAYFVLCFVKSGPF